MRFDTTRRRVLEAVGAGVGLAGTVSTTVAAGGGLRLRPVRTHPPADRLVVRGEDLFTKYEFAVSGRVEPGDAADLTDIVHDGRVVGFAADGSVDDYLFDGVVTEFTDADDLSIWVNGHRVDDPVGEPIPQHARERRARVPDCLSIEPLSYRDWTVTEFYGYDPDTSSPNARRSNTPVDLAEPGVSRLFFYRGPAGLSLGMIHGGDGDDGDAASFRIEGVPAGVEWVVRDDGYEGTDDEFAVADGTATAHWAWGRGNRNDGGALGYLPDEFALTVVPQFSADAEREPADVGGIDRWEFLSGHVGDLDVHELPVDEPVLLLTGRC